MSKNKDVKVKEEKKQSFWEKMKNDKQYSAKIQLMGYGILIVFLVIYLNLSNMGNDNSQGNTIIDNFNDIGSEVENTDKEDTSLLELISDNYSYDMIVDVKERNTDKDNTLEDEYEFSIRYSGKVYSNKQEINKVMGQETELYYRVDNNYYSNKDNVVDFVKKRDVYDIIDGEYIELEDIFNLMNNASLDHVTDYSSGKKEYVYHLRVRDLIVSYQGEEVVEIEVEEENGILKLEIDYSNLFKVMDDDILECELEATIREIGEVEDFEVVVSEGENTSGE